MSIWHLRVTMLFVYYALWVGVAIALSVLLGVLLWSWRRSRAEKERVMSEDALKHVRTCELKGSRSSLESIAGALHITMDQASALADRMLARKLIVPIQEGGFRLTTEGQERALHLIRAHRLWESYLADQTGFSEKEWHRQAEEHEHQLSKSEVAQLSSSLGHPTHDPHGDPIPSAARDSAEDTGRPLTMLLVGDGGSIAHIEDEPQAVYARIAVKGLHRGMKIRVKQISNDGIRVEADGDEYALTPIEAANVSITPLPLKETAEPTSAVQLAELGAGEYGQILTISSACRGRVRRRLMDLGFLPGTTVKAEMSGPLGEPMAYRVRGVLVALRSEQSRLITVRRLKDSKQ
jgi:DtxR family Mn-dependent transcriptional regulator